MITAASPRVPRLLQALAFSAALLLAACVAGSAIAMTEEEPGDDDDSAASGDDEDSAESGDDEDSAASDAVDPAIDDEAAAPDEMAELLAIGLSESKAAETIANTELTVVLLAMIRKVGGLVV